MKQKGIELPIQALVVLFVLLAVGAIIISWALQGMGKQSPAFEAKQRQEEYAVKKTQMETQCKELCATAEKEDNFMKNNAKLKAEAEYCIKSFADGLDITQNGAKNDYDETFLVGHGLCENQIYCYQLNACRIKAEDKNLDMPTCFKIICEYLEFTGLTSQRRDEALKEILKPGQCYYDSTANQKNHWFSELFDWDKDGKADDIEISCEPPCIPLKKCPAGNECGTTDDGCGGTLDCGTCQPNYDCVNNACKCNALTSCPAGWACGISPDGCSGTINCGTCQTGWTCNTTTHKCECTPKTCTSQGWQCGTGSDGCGGTINCGTCQTGYACNAAHQCEKICVPQTTCPSGWECGYAGDGCSGTINCGTCQTGWTCNTTTHKCECTPKTCTSQGWQCGTGDNGCGATLDCGTCAKWWQKCESNQCVDICSGGKPVPCASYGDVDLDGCITEKDAGLVEQHLAGTASLTAQQKTNADVTDISNQITQVDAFLIRKYATDTAGYTNSFPTCKANKCFDVAWFFGGGLNLGGGWVAQDNTLYFSTRVAGTTDKFMEATCPANVGGQVLKQWNANDWCLQKKGKPKGAILDWDCKNEFGQYVNCIAMQCN